MNLVRTILFTIITAGIISAIAVSVWGVHQYQAPGSLAEDALFVVQSGEGFSTISYKLDEAGIISDKRIFKIAARLNGNHTKIRAGEYSFSAQASMEAVLEKMVGGEIYERRVTIAEGLTSWQIVRRLAATDIPETKPITNIPAEGSLLPETYNYTLTDTQSAILVRMAEAMTKTIDELWEERAADLPFSTKEEVLVLASIVEKETGVTSERARIAGVFVNRLKKGMPLQTDPTVIYALTKGEIQEKGQGPLGRRLLRKDLSYDSPYNTYKYAGLPPGPIANPGRAAIHATLHPEAHEYIYFVADGSGGHAFGKTLAEHNANVAKWRKIRAGK